jgi:hypothetical protein
MVSVPFSLARGQDEPVITRADKDRQGWMSAPDKAVAWIPGVLTTMGFLVLGLTQVHGRPALVGHS